MTTAPDGAQDTSATANAGAAGPADGAPAQASANPAPNLADTPAPQAAALPPRPEGLDESFWDGAASAPKWGDINARLARAGELEAADAARAADVPAAATDYKLDIVGEAIKGLDGKDVAIEAKDPLAQAVIAAAAEHKLPQAAVSGLVRAYAQVQVEQTKQMQALVSAETAKLGTNATDRIKAVTNFITQHAGENAGDAIKGLWSAASVIAWEKCMALSQQPTVGAPPGGVPPKKDAADILYPQYAR